MKSADITMLILYLWLSKRGWSRRRFIWFTIRVHLSQITNLNSTTFQMFTS